MRRTILLLTLLLALSATKSSAVVDSMYANNQIAISVDHPEYALGAPDKQQAQINSTGELWLRFDSRDVPTDFAPGAVIHIYWQRTIADSVAAVVSLVHVTSNWLQTKTDSIMVIDQPGMITITVPAAGFNAIHFRLTGNPPATGGAAAFLVDAATLIQDNLGVPSARSPRALFSIFPNPSLISSGIHLNVPEEYVGHSQVVVYNLLGNQVMTSTIDQAQMQLQMDAKGTYIARLIVDGAPMGDAFKFSVE